MGTRSHYLVSLAMLTCLPALRAQDVFSASVRPILEKHCFQCHNEKMMTAGLNLETFRDNSAAQASPEVWRRVLDKVTSGSMPPPAFPPLTEKERGALAVWVEALFGKARLQRPPRLRRALPSGG
jgi:uncharacterized membrane protein